MEATQILSPTRMRGHPRHGGSGVIQGSYLHRCLRMVQPHQERVSSGVHAAGPQGTQPDTSEPKAITSRKTHNERRRSAAQGSLSFRGIALFLLEIIGLALGWGEDTSPWIQRASL